MNLPFFISRRYLSARTSLGVIHLISAISAAGMAVGTAALILILSVYNGFDGIIRDNLSDLDPDLLVRPAEGKCFIPEGKAFDAMYDDPRIVSISSVVSENVFLSYSSHQELAFAKGVDAAYEEESRMDRHMMEGEFSLHRGEQPLASVGAGLAYRMGMHPRFLNRMTIWFPDREGNISLSNPAASLQQVEVRPGSIFSINNDIDGKLLFLPIETMRKLLRYDREVSSLELRLSPGADAAKVLKDTAEELGPEFEVLDRYHQNPVLYKMMRYEKAAIFLILLFVVIIIAFNIFGALSMLVIEKREDIGTLRALGADETTINRIFVLEGWLISLIGLAAGLILGLALALLQQHFGFVKMPGNFLVSAYPVIVRASDILLTAAGVGITGWLIAFLSVKFNKI
ncbi:MAG: FtsX-like permease family protein [Bacteroidales bacterium]|nr:FtsX-like permease family protein [Bacteroidales bacterium]